MSLLRKGHRGRDRAKLVVACDGDFRSFAAIDRSASTAAHAHPCKNTFVAAALWILQNSTRVYVSATPATTHGWLRKASASSSARRPARSDDAVAYDSFRAYLTGERGFHLEEELSGESGQSPQCFRNASCFTGVGASFQGEAAGFSIRLARASPWPQASTCTAAAVLQHWGTGDAGPHRARLPRRVCERGGLYRPRWDLIRQLAPEFWTNAQRGINPGA